MLDTTSWRGFKIDSLFNRFERGKANQTKLEDGDDTFYVGAKRDDNGVMLRCAYDKTLISDGNCIVFICNGQGSVGFANYMDRDFVASTDLVLGYADWLNTDVGMFLATVFSLERPKYSFGRKWGRFLKDTVVQLPVESDVSGEPIIDPDSPYSSEGYLPDWRFMEDFIKSLNHKPLTTENLVPSSRAADLKLDSWAWFSLGGPNGLFDIKKGKRLTAADQTEGTTPYIGAIESNNGVSNRIGQSAIHQGNTISLSYNGSVGEAFYQPDPYWSTDDVNALYLRSEYGELTPAIGLFISTILRQEKYRFSYGRKWTLDNMNATSIRLPVTSDGNPDWQFMEDYMRSLPYGDRIPEAQEVV